MKISQVLELTGIFGIYSSVLSGIYYNHPMFIIGIVFGIVTLMSGIGIRTLEELE